MFANFVDFLTFELVEMRLGNVKRPAVAAVCGNCWAREWVRPTGR